MKITNLPLPANYIHNNGDKEPVTILDIDGKGRAWVKWSDNFVNMVPCERLEFRIDSESIQSS